MQHLNLIDENQTIYESLAILNNNFQSLLSCMSGATAPVVDSNTPIAAGTLWYNTTENRVYQMDYNTPANWVLVSDLSGTGTTKEYVDNLISTHNHDSTYLKLDAPAKDVQFVNGKPADTVIYKSNISDVQGTSDRYIAPSSRLFEATRQQVRAFIDTLGNPDEILKQLEEILQLIRDNQGDLDNLGIDNISGLRVALDGKMPLATTLEDLGGVRADGGTVTGFTGRILFNKTSAIANGGVIAVGREGVATTLHAVSMWDDGGTNPDAVQIGDNTAPTYINALSPDDAFIAVGGTTRHKIWNEGNIADLDTVLAGRDFMKEAAADLKYLRTNGKAVDSALLNGVAESTAQSNNTIVKRNSVGDIVTRYFRTNAGAGVSSDVNYFLVQRATGTGGDNYARPVSATNVKNALGIQNLPNWTQAEFDSRYLNASGDTVTGDFTVNGTFFANNFCVKDLPEMQMGNGGVNDEYLIISRRYTGTTLDASGLAGHFKFHRGSSTKTHAISDIFIVLSVDNDHDAIGLFDQYGTPIFDSIDAITVGGVAYYAVKIRGSGGGDDATFWQFEGQVINNINDSRILTRVRLSDSNVTFVSTKWNPASAVNSFNLRSQGSSHFLLRDGTNNMTGDVKINNDKFHVNIGRGGIRRNVGNIILCDHNNGHVTISAGGNVGNLYLGYNSGSTYQTGHVRLESDLYTKANALLTIDASTGQIFDEGERVYSPKNNSAIGVLSNANTWTGLNRINRVGELLRLGGGSELDSKDAYVTLGNSTTDGSGYWWKLKYVGSTSGAGGNQFRIESAGANPGKYWEFDHDGNFEYWDGSATQKMWHSGNDGSGSGLDADTLDGFQGSQLTRNDYTGAFNNKGHYEVTLPYFQSGEGNVTDEYLVIGPADASSSSRKGAVILYGTIYGARGSTGSGTKFSMMNIAYNSSYSGNYISVDYYEASGFHGLYTLKIGGVLHFAVKAPTGGGNFDHSAKFVGAYRNVRGATNVLTKVRSSASNVTEVAAYRGATKHFRGNVRTYGSLVLERGNLEVQNPQAVITLETTQDVEGKASTVRFNNVSNQNVQIRHNAHDSTRAPYGLHIEKTADNSQQSLKAYLQVEGEIHAGGNIASNGKLTANGTIQSTSKIYAKGEITSSNAALQVKGFQRTGGIYLHEGTSSPDPAKNLLLENSGGRLRWDGSNVATLGVENNFTASLAINSGSVVNHRFENNSSVATYRCDNAGGWRFWTPTGGESLAISAAGIADFKHQPTYNGSALITRANSSKGFSGSNNTGSTSLRWYRIARATGGSPASGIFTVRGTRGGHHSVVTFAMSCCFGQRPTITVLNNSQYGSSGIHQVRLEYASTYDEFNVQVQADCDALIWEATNCISFYESWVANDTADRSGIILSITGDYGFMTNASMFVDDNINGVNSMSLSGTLTASAVTCGGDLLVGNSSSNRWKIDTDSSNHLNIVDWSGRKGISLRDADAVELFHNNSRKLATTSGGVNIYGKLSASNGVTHKLISSRTSNGTWTITGVSTGVPLWITLDGVAQTKYAILNPDSGTNIGNPSRSFYLGLPSNSAGGNSSGEWFRPLNSTVVFTVSSLVSGATVRAYQ